MVDDDEAVYALELSELDRSYFNTHAQEDPPSESTAAKLRSHRLMRQARIYLKATVEQELQSVESKNIVRFLKSLKNTVAEKVKLVAIEVNSEDEAFLIFETLNDRGLRLSVPDLLLNHLMRSANNESERVQVRQSWNTVVENLGLRKVSTFLRHMWVSMYGDVKSQGLYPEIRERMKDKSLESLEFAKICEAESEKYTAITELKRSELGDAHRDIEALVKNLSADRALPLLLSGFVCLDESDFTRLAKTVLNIVVRHAVLANLNPNVLENALYSAARAIRNCYEEGEGSAKSFQAAKEIFNRINPSRDQIESGATDVFLTKPQAQLILLRIAEKMQSATKTLTFNDTSIEHIFPENSAQGEWPNASELEPNVWHLGNLTLLEPRINRDLGNKGFDAKREGYARSEITMTVEVGQRYSEWTNVNIQERAKAMVAVIEQVWPSS